MRESLKGLKMINNFTQFAMNKVLQNNSFKMNKEQKLSRVLKAIKNKEIKKINYRYEIDDVITKTKPLFGAVLGIAVLVYGFKKVKNILYGEI